MIEDWQLAPLPADELLEAWAAEAEERDIPRDNVQWRRTGEEWLRREAALRTAWGARSEGIGREATERRPG